ncbi:hypothetical protein ECC02_012250 [Trypanosoma cruzi]|uniref:Uncharacterized protein n=1 Tax=Trypanosoma cruzi TaxID=5693 RepID=A0A7J6XLI7_TRYCR|nr:hypothetical protein ECC02_012250 [Trypanosoma cruzi]
MSSTLFQDASTFFTRFSCSVRRTETIPDDGFSASPFFSYSAINFSLLPPLLYSRELAATSSSPSTDTGPISAMCVLSVSQRWSSPFSFPFSSLSVLAYTGRVTSITSLSSIVAVVNPLPTPFSLPSCLLLHTRESVPSASVHKSPLSQDSYTLRRPSPHAVIMMSFSFHSTTEGSLQPSADIPFDSVQLLVSEEYMISETLFPSSASPINFFLASSGNTSVPSSILTPDPPPPIKSVKDPSFCMLEMLWRASISFQ